MIYNISNPWNKVFKGDSLKKLILFVVFLY